MQGIVGSIPWTALVFFTLYLQLLGMTDVSASVLMALFLGSTGVIAALQCLKRLPVVKCSQVHRKSGDMLQGDMAAH